MSNTAFECPAWQKYGNPPPKSCPEPKDPLKMPKSPIENWLTESTFDDLFPKANLGWGPSNCRPYNYKAFVIAARYFPKFGTEYVTNDPTGKPLNTNYTRYETYRRDLSAFFAHAIQETGENNVDLYNRLPKKQAEDCFYRGGFFNWFEGGPVSPIVKNHGLDPTDGIWCTEAARYCDQGSNNKWFYPCARGSQGGYYKVSSNTFLCFCLLINFICHFRKFYEGKYLLENSDVIFQGAYLCKRRSFFCKITSFKKLHKL